MSLYVRLWWVAGADMSKQFSVEIFKEKKTGTEKDNIPMSVRVLKTESKDVVQG